MEINENIFNPKTINYEQAWIMDIQIHTNVTYIIHFINMLNQNYIPGKRLRVTISINAWNYLVDRLDLI